MKTLKDLAREGFIVAVQRTAGVSEATRVMEASNVGIVAVLDGTKLVGLFSERDVVRRVVNCGRDPHRTPVEEVMTRTIVVASIDEDCQAAMHKMDQANIRHLPIVDGGALIGMLSVRDIIQSQVQKLTSEIHYLKDYIASA